MDTTSLSGGPKPVSSTSTAEATRTVALAGNPNSGKTSLFNALTGLRHKVGNYPGVTVERTAGTIALGDGSEIRAVDLPGTYSLNAVSDDERVARDVLLGLVKGEAAPDVVLAVADASTLPRSLFFVTQVLELGLPVVVALTMGDVAKRRGSPVDPARLSEALGVEVIAVDPRSAASVAPLRAAIANAKPATMRRPLPAAVEEATEAIAASLQGQSAVPERALRGEALRLLLHAGENDRFLASAGAEVAAAVRTGRDALQFAGIDRLALEAEAHYAWVDGLGDSLRPAPKPGPHLSERADRILTHPIVGPLIFLLVMGTIFQAVYTWSGPFMELIEGLTGSAQVWVAGALGDGMLKDLIVDGVIAGVGNVIIFLPQICLLFLFLTVFEDLGYLARAAFLVDRVMRAVGLSGKSFVPLMSSFACAIPGIMAARTIESRRDRMVTILVAPFMSCSARLPVYALMIGAFIPLGYQGLTLLSMYALSVAAALIAAWILRKTLFRGESSTYLMELPAYRMPNLRNVVRTVWSRGRIFVTEAGTIILAFSIILWALAYFPRSEALEVQAEARVSAGEDADEVAQWKGSAQAEQSYAGRIGKTIEPVIAPLGFDWKVGVGLVASFAAREVLVSTLGIMYAVGDEVDEESIPLRERMQADRKPDGSPTFSWLTALSLMVFFVLASQCMSTLAIVKRETNSWRWPIFMFVYMTTAAYVASLVVYQGGKLLIPGM